MKEKKNNKTPKRTKQLYIGILKLDLDWIYLEKVALDLVVLLNDCTVRESHALVFFL